MTFDLDLLVVAVLIFEMVVRVAAFFIVPHNRKPSSATAWLLLIMLFPSFGLLAFLLIGSPKLSKSRRLAQGKMNAYIEGIIRQASSNPSQTGLLHTDVPVKYQPFVELNTNLSKLPAFGGNSIELISDYPEILRRIAKDIDGAKKYAHIEFFIITFDEETEQIFNAMERAAKRGVKIRLLVDAIGIRYPGKKEMVNRLEQAGIEWHTMLPLRMPGKKYTRPDLRNHRKIVVIDGQIGYTGSLNLVRRNYHRKDQLYYDELMARIVGPSVLQLQALFITDWFSETDELINRQNHKELDVETKNAGNSLVQILPSGPGFDHENNLKLFNSLIYSAQERIVITNPYFVPDESLLGAIITAAMRGVKVSILQSEIMDQNLVGHAQRSYYEQLLKAGIQIYWYPWPILLHSKHISIDDQVCVIGSSNFDIRSFELNLEVSMIVYDPVVTRQLQKIEAIYIERSRPVKLSEWQRRSWGQKLLDNLARLTSALQ